MIKYRLGCPAGHEFESWFRAMGDFDSQSARGMIACPTCGSAEIAKLPMAPALLSGRASKVPLDLPAVPSSQDDRTDILGKLRAFKQSVVENSEDVGNRFADEARKIHFGEAAERRIRGSSTNDEARGLIEDGVPFGVLPPLPEDLN